MGSTENLQKTWDVIAALFVTFSPGTISWEVWSKSSKPMDYQAVELQGNVLVSYPVASFLYISELGEHMHFCMRWQYFHSNKSQVFISKIYWLYIFL